MVILFNLSYMQRGIYCVLFFLLIKNLSFSQSIEQTIGTQFDEISLSAIQKKEFVICTYLLYQVYVVKRTQDSLLVVNYGTGTDNKIGGVCSISVNDDTLLAKTVDMLYSDIKQNHSCKPYSKKILIDDVFFLTFYENNKLQIFNRKNGSQDQLKKVKFIFNRLNLYSSRPFSGHNKLLNFLKIENWNELLKYLKDGTVDGQSR